jgi:hypothetical protein
MAEKSNIALMNEGRMIIRPEILEVMREVEISMRELGPIKSDEWKTSNLDEQFIVQEIISKKIARTTNNVTGNIEEIMPLILDRIRGDIMLYHRFKFMGNAFDIHHNILNVDENITMNQRTVRQIQSGDRCPNCKTNCNHFSEEGDCCVTETVSYRRFTEKNPEQLDMIFEYNNKPLIPKN